MVFVHVCGVFGEILIDFFLQICVFDTILWIKWSMGAQGPMS